MIAKILAFVLLSLGALAAVGMLGSFCPSVKDVAMHVGEHAISYSNLVFVASAIVVLWLSSKV